jgi:hypothetical protein
VLLENSFVVPDAALADGPPALRAPAGPAPCTAGLGGERDELCQEPANRTMTLRYPGLHI